MWITSRSHEFSAKSPTCSRSRATTRSRFARTATRATSFRTIRTRWPIWTQRGCARFQASARTWPPGSCEIAETGASSYHRELLAEFPPTVLDLLRLQGVGPKTVATLYRELGVRTLEDLEQAAVEGRVRALRGMGPKKEALILKALEERKRHAGRHLLADATGVAEDILTATSGVTRRLPRSRVVGSARRGCETCGDSTSSRRAQTPSLMEIFVGYRLVERVLGRGDTKSSVLLSGGYQADLRLVAPQERGAALQYFTGSKAHNIALRDRAIVARLQAERVRALPDRRRTAVVAGDREEDVYEALGLAWIPPELREARGEVEAAADRRLPRLVRARERSSATSTCTPPRATERTTSAAWPRRLRQAGLQYIAITDHSQSLAMANGLDETPGPVARGAHSRGRPRRRHRRPPARRHRVRHPRRRLARPRRRLSGRARPRRRLRPLGIRPGTPADDRPGPSSHRASARGHPRTPDRSPASCGANPTRSTSRRSSPRPPGMAWRSRSTARSTVST